jgi:hypothetical protein
MSLEQILSDMMGRTIIDVGTEDDELMISLDDGVVIWVYVEDEELVMSVSHEEKKPPQ